MAKFPKSQLLDYVREHPTARVRDFSEVFLDGLLLASTGGTGRGYEAVNRHLEWARRKLHLAPLTRGCDYRPRKRTNVVPGIQSL